MEGTPAIYQGRILSQLDKDHFRAYIYAQNGERKLVNSWNEFESHMSTGIWFSAINETKPTKKMVEQDVIPTDKKINLKTEKTEQPVRHKK